MWGMRNRIAHTHSPVEAAAVIATVLDDLPEIRAWIRAYFDASGAGGEPKALNSSMPSRGLMASRIGPRTT